MLPLCIFSMLLCQTPIAVNSSFITQDSGIRQAVVGKTVTLHCSCSSTVVTFYTWYQQKLGGKPVAISTRMRGSQASLSEEYNARFSVAGGEDVNNLTISNLLLSDSAMYYCGILEFNAIEFGAGLFLHVRTSWTREPWAVHQPALVQLPLGHPLNLSCYTHAKDCKEEHSMFWLQQSTGKPAVIHQNVGHCMKEPSSGKINCTSYFSIKSVNLSDAGMYYCALVSCGEIRFGRGTLVQFPGDSRKVTYLLYGLIVALVIAVSLLLALAFVLYKLKRCKSCPICKGTISHTLPPSGTVDQDENVLHYAALSLKKANEHHHQQDTEESACVYSRVRSRKE